MSKVALGFVPEPRTIAIDKILPSRKTPVGLATSRKFRQIQSSVEEIGLIEPLTVSPINGGEGGYTLLDGHMRLLVLRELGVSDVPCLEALDDESYTYNNRVNRLSSIQEHYMIRRALDRGVSPERLAKPLNLDISQIRKRSQLLDGICPEARAFLEDRHFSTELSRVIRKMKPTRQVECLELMVSANNLSVPYAEALLAATPVDLLVDGKKPRKLSGVTKEQMARMEREMGSLQTQYRLVEQTYGQDVLTLVIVRGFLVKMLANDAIARFLRSKSPEFLEQFEAIVATQSIDS
jgi:hypothetical protein